MTSSSPALAKALSALQHNFPSLILPSTSTAEPFFAYLQRLTLQLRPSPQLATAIEKMKNASDAQEYRIQRSLLQTDSQQSFSFMEELCYQAHSTGILGERDLFTVRAQAEGSSIVDDIWWNAEKKIESIEYFLD